MLIRPAAEEDAGALTDLHLDVWDEAYGGLIAPEILRDRRAHRDRLVARWRANLADGAGRTLLAVDGDTGGLLGFVSTGARRDDTEPALPGLEVWALYVRAEVYGAGVGHALLERAIGDAAAYLWVLDGNERATTFYERQGFRFDGRRKTESVGVERRMVRAAG